MNGPIFFLQSPILLVIFVAFSRRWNFEWLHSTADAIRASALLVAIVVILAFGLRLLLRRWDWASFGVLCIVVGFLFYEIGSGIPSILVATVAFILLIERSLDIRKIVLVANVMATVVLVVMLAALYQREQVARPVGFQSEGISKKAEFTTNPNIFHMVLDGYGSHETYEAIFDYDNSPFLDELRALGFVVFDDVVTPFNQTLPTMASILNGAYVEKPEDGEGAEEYRRRLAAAIRTSRVSSLFRESGYAITQSDPGLTQLHIEGASLLPRRPLFHPTRLEGSLLPNSKAFEVSAHLSELNAAFTPGLLNEIETPFFHYQHTIAPHPPFIVTSKGSPRVSITSGYKDANGFILDDLARREEYIEGFVEKTRFVEQRVLKQMSQLPSTDLIVIIQGDHGPAAYTHFEKPNESCFSERMTTFLAIYAGDPVLSARLAEHSSQRFNTVNIYRFLLPHLTNQSYRPLDAESYFLRWDRPDIQLKVDDSMLNMACPKVGPKE